MQELINDLLTFSRVGRIGERRRRVELRPLRGRGAPRPGRRWCSIRRAEIEIGELPAVTVEPSLLRTVFQNLLSNAIKFHGADPPRVRIDSERDGDEWRISVADNGIGIEPRYAERIFVIFQRLHGRASIQAPGSAWRCAGRSSSTTAGASGSTPPLPWHPDLVHASRRRAGSLR